MIDAISTDKTQAKGAIYRAVQEPGDGFCVLDGYEVYRISDYDQMPPFLMTVVSDTDLWNFISSNGGLTAGRINEDRAIFPYETDDKLHKCHRVTGPFTLLRLQGPGGRTILWEPFAPTLQSAACRRNLYKTLLGNRVIFEEIRPDLGLRFRYHWSNSASFGWVRTSILQKDKPAGSVEIEVLDGLLNVLPAGPDLHTSQRASCLINSYTRCEVDEPTGAGIYSMASLITDKPQPAESLRANIVWSSGLDSPQVLLTTDQLQSFIDGKGVKSEKILKGRRGAYLVYGRVVLTGADTQTWDIVADAALDQAGVEKVVAMLNSPASVKPRLDADIRRSSEELLRNVASADGLQIGADRLATSHHFANVLFNNMRGGVFLENHRIPAGDFLAFVKSRNRGVAKSCAAFFAMLRDRQPVAQLLKEAAAYGNADLLRLCHEYLPITFSRRHGDPSRPWNRFNIQVKNSDGSQTLNYQGNWRDIFQNWEALCPSFPGFIASVTARFVNASTIDGFNPYRVTREGFEWEIPEPHDPWAHIGYWGDHQIIYLLRLLELFQRFDSAELVRLLEADIFSYANVPYRIRPFDTMVRDRWHTIDFDRELNRDIHHRVDSLGADAKLLQSSDGSVYHVTLLEKLLVPLLSKLSNLVVDGGIWMNTQRPEWNDANNALVGNGVSMVTHCYLRRYVAFVLQLLSQWQGAQAIVSSEVSQWLLDVTNVLESNRAILQQDAIGERERFEVLKELGHAFDRYRLSVYQSGFSGKVTLSKTRISELLRLSMGYLDYGIRANRRADGLYHAYNLIQFPHDRAEARLDHLYEMLEGQVAVLSSGCLDDRESAQLIGALFDSKIYRPDQKTFMLYPERTLPSFLERNSIPPDRAQSNALLRRLIDAADRTIIRHDPSGRYRFNADFKNAADLATALDQLHADPAWTGLVAQHRQEVMDVYEGVFNHRAFTGRSGSMYGYEGLGCIYWHMVSKLLLAVQECYFRSGAPAAKSLADFYYRIRDGLGVGKSAKEYGAFPTDPYSHTPKHTVRSSRA